MSAAPAVAQSGGFVYALDQVNGAPNQIYGFSVNPTTGVLFALAGFPVSTGGNGGVGAFSQHLFYDRVNSRLYALNENSATVSGFAVNRFTGALTALPFSPIALPAGDYGCVAVDPTGAVLAASGGTAPGSTFVATFLIGATTATAAPGSPFASSPPFSCAFSQDGAYLYTGGDSGNLIGGFAVNPANAVLTPLAGSPFDSGGLNPVGYATDATGRLFVSNYASGVGAFTTVAGIPSAVAGSPFASGLTGGIHGIVTPSGFYMVADRAGNRVGVFSIGSTGALAAVSGSPFASGGTFTSALALDHRGILLFASNATSRNITTFRVASTNPALTSLTTQAANSVGATGTITGIAFAPPATGGFVYALDQVNAGTNQVYGFSVDATTGALTALAGFPKAAGTGGGGSLSEQLFYDRVNGRLFVLNDTAGAGTVSAFAVDQGNGALTALPFSPIALPAGTGGWACLTTAGADGSVLIAAGALGAATFKLTGTSAVAAPGSPVATTGAAPFSCAASRDGAFFYTGGNSGGTVAGFSVNATNGSLTALSGSPFATGSSNPVGYATDLSGRLFVSNFAATTLNVFSTSSGIPTAVSGGPFTSGITGGVRGVVTATGLYLLADRSGNHVGSYIIGGAGAGTTLTPAGGSPFATGGSFTSAVAADDTGTLAFAANAISRNITTFSVSSAGVLTSLGVQLANTLGAAGIVTGIAFAPRAPSSAITEIIVPAAPRGITKGPDGNVWFTEISANKVARITPVGIITEFSAPSASGPDGITTGPDGNLWYAGFNGNKIGRVTPAGVVTEFAAGTLSAPALIASGPDGNLWFTEFNSSKIGRMTTAGTLTEFSAGITAAAQPFGIAAGPDGNLWFTEAAANKIGRITVGGTVTEFPLPTASSFPAAIVAGPDGALWFAETGTSGTADRIGRITTSGVITEFGGLLAGPGGITLGPDGNLWFSTSLGVGRITPGGTVTEYTPPTSPISSVTFPAFITAGPDGNIWFAEQSNNKVSVLALPQFGLSILRNGTGTGTVTSAPASLNCGATCGAPFADGALITLTGTPAAGSRLSAWTGAGCSGTGTCVVALSSATVVTATFTQQFTLAVSRVGTGTVTSNVAGISCGATCAAPFDVGTVVTLTASPPAGSRFVGWLGAGCSGTSTCVVTMNAAASVTATFVQQFTLTVTPGGTGTGTVTSSPAGISCGATCVMIVDAGTVVTLTAAPGSDAVFSAWTSGGCGVSPTCIVTVSASTGIGAIFTFQLPTVTLSASRVNFGALNDGAGTLVKQTPPQTITLTQSNPGAVTWTASADQPWITVTPASGGITDTITVAIQNAAHTLPTAGVVSGTVTLTTTGAANNPTAAINLTVLNGVSSPPEGSFDTPVNGTGGVTGSIAVTGWAVDDIGATTVRIMRAPVAGEDPASQVFIGTPCSSLARGPTSPQDSRSRRISIAPGGAT